MSAPRFRTIQGVAVPSFFYGTAWKEQRTKELTELALSSGFRGIDTANQRRHYFEAGVGAAVADAIGGGVSKREELFLQTKFTFVQGQDHRLPYDPHASVAEQVRQSFESSLEHLGTSYVDALILHGPSSRSGLRAADWEAWREMEALHGEHRARFIGVSNVSIEQLAALVRDAQVQPAFVQNRCFAATGWDREIRAFCTANAMTYQGFSLLTANGNELACSAVRQIVLRTGHTLPQVVFRFALELGMIPLTGTTRGDHMRDDLDCFDFDLDEAAIKALETLAG